jgi:sister-chromatid-cohesion protein PDS5
MPPKKEISKDTLYGGVINPASKKNELVTYLTDLHKNLSQLSQNAKDRPKGISITADQLINPKILNHADKDIRLLTSCCIADVLRIFAPDAPFSDEDTMKAFDMMIAQIRGIATVDLQSTAGVKMLYILNSLATVKSCVVPVMMFQRNIEGAEELVISLVDSVMNSLRPEHSEEGGYSFRRNIQTCLLIT